MTKTKTYKYGPHTFKSYMKPVGNGWEVGFTYQGRNYFTGNFIHKAEVAKWWGIFNKEIVSFSKKFNFSKDMPFNWYCNFLSNTCTLATIHGWIQYLTSTKRLSKKPTLKISRNS